MYRATYAHKNVQGSSECIKSKDLEDEHPCKSEYLPRHLTVD